MIKYRQMKNIVFHFTRTEHNDDSSTFFLVSQIHKLELIYHSNLDSRRELEVLKFLLITQAPVKHDNEI